ncbi:hypothetical protein TIFTF001_023862 [Ficus carica]|uniref:Response regulatory domain-containing protein n=1 Tax=Ficus carica TaxID=3494 RepID=A0AA88AFK3_FICCA|nr:hypothetical protein TIFTF001_023862 [Ficus carica]
MAESRNEKSSVPASPSGPAYTWTVADFLSGEFPAGLRVLLVDEDPVSLLILERLLQTSLYQVTKCDRAEEALSLLREKKDGFDIILSDVHMADMDGIKFLDCIVREMDIPVIMLSADERNDVLMKAVIHGACAFFVKPVRPRLVQCIWEHVLRKKVKEEKALNKSAITTLPNHGSNILQGD